jgi:heat-inducible transcriptional repressor
MEIGDLTENDRQPIEAQVAAAGTLGGNRSSPRPPAAVRIDPRRRRCAHGQVERGSSTIEFVRLEPERALVVLVAEDGRSRTASCPCRRLADFGADRGVELPQRRIRGRRLPMRAPSSTGAGSRPGRARSADAEDRRAGLASWSGGERATSAS